MARILLLERDEEQVDPYERQAMASATRADVDALEFTRTGPHNCVLLSVKEQAPRVMDAVAQGTPHYIFMQDTISGAPSGRRLFMLLPTGEFMLCRRQKPV